MTRQVKTGNFGPTMIWPVLDIRPDGVTRLYNRGCVIGWLWRVIGDTAAKVLTIRVTPADKLEKAFEKNKVLSMKCGAERRLATPRSRMGVYAAALWRASSAWYSLNSSPIARAMLGRVRSRS